MARRLADGSWSVRLRYGADLRGRFRLPAMSEAEAQRRERRLESMARALSRVELHAEARVLLTAAARAPSDKLLRVVEEKASEVVAGAGARERAPVTFRDACELWWSGELHRRAPDRVRSCTPRSMAQGRARLLVLCETIGDVPLTRVTIDTAERALASLPAGLSKPTRRQYAQRLMHVMRLATLPPLRVIEHSPIPSGWAPANGPRRAFSFIYPAEDAKLLRCNAVDIEHRWLWGFLAREGCRISEALALTWGDVALEQGVIRLDKNKTRVPRCWMLCAHVVDALKERSRRARGEVGDRVFSVRFDEHTSAAAFRADLRTAGVARAELYESTPERSPIRAHDLRGTFVTLALAAGKTEAWVMDRTGHRTSNMLATYRRQARLAEELGLGWLEPLSSLLRVGHVRATRAGGGGKSGPARGSAASPVTRQSAAHAAKQARSSAAARVCADPGPAESAPPGHAESALTDALRAAQALVSELTRQLESHRPSRAKENR